jgi:hypothetical protein
MLTQQSDMGAAAESARNNQIDSNAAASGASGRDPSLQGAKAANFAARQVGNQRAAGDIAAKANSANFGAQMDAAGTLNNNAMTRAQWNQSANNNAQAFLPWNQPSSGQSRQESYINFNGFQPGGNATGRAPQQQQGGLWAGDGNDNGMSQTAMDYRKTQAWQDDYNRSMGNDQYYYDMGL